MVVQGNTYSVPSRLVGTTLLVRVRAEHLEAYLGSKPVVTLPRLHGRAQHAINYRHLIWSLVRKPGAFAAYRYRDDLYPSLAFRRAYDRLTRATPTRADREYVRVLHLAATISEAEVETALLLLEDAHPRANGGLCARSGSSHRRAAACGCAGQFAALRPVASITEVCPCLIDGKN